MNKIESPRPHQSAVFRGFKQKRFVANIIPIINV